MASGDDARLPSKFLTMSPGARCSIENTMIESTNRIPTVPSTRTTSMRPKDRACDARAIGVVVTDYPAGVSRVGHEEMNANEL